MLFKEIMARLPIYTGNMYRLYPLQAILAILSSVCFVTTQVQAQQSKKDVTVLYAKQNGAFPLVTGGKASTVFFDTNESTVIRIATKDFRDDVAKVTGVPPAIDSSDGLQPYSIIVGTIGKSRIIDQLINGKKLNLTKVKGQWETFAIAVVDHPFSNVTQALVIAGSDARGTAFGIFELSKMIGVSPWYWWADVTPVHKKELFISSGTNITGPPSVKYRGIFINDEDWGLQPWAAKTFEPETGDIGPKTYAKVFELLLRLKANLIWPAMHPSTKAFFHYHGNAEVAADYNIILGSSHAEPMLRNNVGEWDETTMGHFNYITNKETVQKYWEDRIKESSGLNAIYTMGMRGVHDSRMEGVKDDKEAVPLLEQIIADQRDLLTRYIAKDATTIPQVFTAYKEVLEIYDAGLKLPDDITLVWPDDNYGYIQRLDNEKEKARAGGSGVYYHASYWGRPHDYLWLSSTHPSLLREEMMKAYATGANRLWVMNVGDIKPLEYNIEMFLDMAYHSTPFLDSRYVKIHLLRWVSDNFGARHARQIGNVLWNYYQLAFERKPEFMGWSQTEPTTKTNFTKYDHFYYGDEAQKRIDGYDALEQEVRTLRTKMDAGRKEAFYELVYYPVVGASLMNKKFLFHDKAWLYAKQNRLSALDYEALSKAAYDSIVKETDYYNTVLAGGKWKNIMSMKPRDLPVFQSPEVTEIKMNASESWGIAPEGYVTKDSSLVKGGGMILPTFDDIHTQQYFIDLFLSRNQTVSWTCVTSNSWIQLSQGKGVLTPEPGKNQIRIWVSIDWNNVSKEKELSGQIIFTGGDKRMIVEVPVRKLRRPGLVNYKGFIENNGFISIHAADFSRGINRQFSHWEILDGIGYSGKSLESMPLEQMPVAKDTSIKNNGAMVEYLFYTFAAVSAEVTVFALPTHALNNNYGMRYGVSLDKGPMQIVDFATTGRSEEWKQNVLSNRAVRKIVPGFLNHGYHSLKIYAVDPGVILDEIRIDLGGMKSAYGVIPETK